MARAKLVVRELVVVLCRAAVESGARVKLEIERKFLVEDGRWRAAVAEAGVRGVRFRQGYLCAEPERTVRVRLEGARGVLTVKGPPEGFARMEYEYEIPEEDARRLLETLCLRPQVDKTRYRVPYAGRVWEIDEFHGDNAPLVVAEVELDGPGARVRRPPWVGREVSSDRRYSNSSLARQPYSTWMDAGVERRVSGAA